MENNLIPRYRAENFLTEVRLQGIPGKRVARVGGSFLHQDVNQDLFDQRDTKTQTEGNERGHEKFKETAEIGNYVFQ